jgi:hypothetical protein
MLCEIDQERLGRYDANKQSGSRRQRPRFEIKGRSVRNYDACRGYVLYRIYADHEDDEGHSAQRFIDTYGRGPFLRRLPSPWTLYNVHVHR